MAIAFSTIGKCNNGSKLSELVLTTTLQCELKKDNLLKLYAIFSLAVNLCN